MHTTLNILDAEQARYRALNATLATAPLPHLEIADRRAQRDRRDAFQIPHIDSDARLRAVRNAIIAECDRAIATAVMVTATVAGGVVLAAAAQVVALFVGGAL